MALARSSCTRRRVAALFAFMAARKAVPWSQLASASRLRIDVALRARTRNVAWKASSASSACLSTCAHTPSTIGPWAP